MDPIADPSAAVAGETFGLSWPGRSRAVRELSRPPRHGLAPLPEGCVRPEGARHAFVEGENLEVGRLLLPAYEGRAKLVYLDPPYNTGELMTFADDFRGRAGDDPRAARHAGWLSMMYPRLELARRLLRADGIVLVSVDDHEVHHLRVLLDEIFGPDRLLGVFVWRRRSGAMDATAGVSQDHEYVVAYARERARLAGEPRTFARYRNPDGDPRGEWIADNLSAAKPGGETLYPITDPTTGHTFWPPRGRYWPYNPQTMARKIAEGRVIFPATPDGTPMLKRFRAEARRTHRPVSTWIAARGDADPEADDVAVLSSGLTTEGTRALKQLFGEAVFRYPKPVSLLRNLVRQASAGDELVVDYFAGSATTAQAVLEANAADGGRRGFLCVQQAEPLPDGPYRTIAEVAVERIRRLLATHEAVGVAAFRLCAADDPRRDRALEARLAAGTPLVPASGG